MREVDCSSCVRIHSPGSASRSLPPPEKEKGWKSKEARVREGRGEEEGRGERTKAKKPLRRRRKSMRRRRNKRRRKKRGGGGGGRGEITLPVLVK